MSDNLPAVREPDRTPAVADVDSWIPVLANVGDLAVKIAGTEFVPKGLRNKPAAVAAAILYGREVGLPPMTALTQTHVIEGKPSMSAEAMRALIFAAGHEMIVDEATGAQAVMRARRAGSETWTPLTWTLDMARAAGLLGKDNWKHYPRAMLVARCTAELARMVFPDVIHGFRAVEEVEDVGPDQGPAEQLAASTGTSKVSRRRKTPQLPAAEAPREAAPQATVAALPLPGEPGYDDMTTQTPAAGPLAGEASGGPEPAEPAPGGVEDGPAESAGEPASDDDETGGRPAADDAPEGVDVGPHHEEADPAAGEESGGADAVPPPRAPSRAQQRMLMAVLGNYGIADDAEERHAVAGRILGRQVDTFKSLTATETTTLIDTFARCKTINDVYDLLNAMDQADAERCQACGTPGGEHTFECKGAE